MLKDRTLDLYVKSTRNASLRYFLKWRGKGGESKYDRSVDMHLRYTSSVAS